MVEDLYNEKLEETERFQKVWKKLFKNEDGQFALKMLKEIYVDPSSIGKDAHTTYYLLGQKELIQNLIATASESEE